MQNHRIKTACATGAFTLAMAMPALSDSDNQVTRQMLSEADRIAIFGRDSNFQVALLTKDEMAETKGAWWPFIGHWGRRMFWGGFFGGLARGYDIRNSMYLHGHWFGHPRMMGDYMMLGSVVGLLGSNPFLAGATTFGAKILHDEGRVPITISRLQQYAVKHNWVLMDFLDDIGRGMENSC